jgi:hypothetical protein
MTIFRRLAIAFVAGTAGIVIVDGSCYFIWGVPVTGARILSSYLLALVLVFALSRSQGQGKEHP